MFDSIARRQFSLPLSEGFLIRNAHPNSYVAFALSPVLTVTHTTRLRAVLRQQALRPGLTRSDFANDLPKLLHGRGLPAHCNLIERAKRTEDGVDVTARSI